MKNLIVKTVSVSALALAIAATASAEYKIEPPEWLMGTWTGTSDSRTPNDTSDDVGKVAVVEAADVSFGDYDLATGAQVAGDLTSFSMFPMMDPNATFTVHENSDSVYSYTIEFKSPDRDVKFTDTFTKLNDSELNYVFEMGGRTMANITMTDTAASEFILPPSWLEGRWEGLSSDGSTQKFSIVSDSDISFGDIVDGQDQGISFSQLLNMDEDSSFKVLESSDSVYSYTMTFVHPQSGDLVSFTDHFEKNGNGVDYTFTMGGNVVDAFTLNAK